MDTPSETSSWSRAADWFRASPLELTGLAILLTGALAASWALWWTASQRPSELPSAILEVGDAGHGGYGEHGGHGVDGGSAVTDPHDSDHRHDAGNGHEAAANNAGNAHDPAATDGGAQPAEGQVGNVPSELTVHVTGAVASPGLVTVPAGARVGAAVDAAGGLSAEAVPEAINLARVLADGEHVHVPRPGEEPMEPPSSASPADPASATGDGRIDINRATAAELESLPGIGPARADAIIRHREAKGPFAVPGDLREVSGIGEVTFQQLADLISVG